MNNDCSHGPVRTMPGSYKTAGEGSTCDECGIKANHRVQGETDSFGCEYIFFCDKHYKEFKSLPKAELDCGRCGHIGTDVIAWRDPEEGMCGPVSYRCKECRDKYLAELREYDDWYENKYG